MTWAKFVNDIQTIGILAILKSIVLIIAGFILARLLSHALNRFFSKYTTSQQLMVIQKITYFVVLILFLIAALQELGFKLSVLLGSAGIATAAIAIASQTSISNIVSGLFLILEKSFTIGDKIQIGNISGTIISIDLLSVKILTPNNTLIRIPNESIIKTDITNVTRFEMRRLDISVTVAYKENIQRVKNILLEIAYKGPFVKKEPLPTVSIQDLADLGVVLQLSVWSLQKDIDHLKDKLLEDIKITFEEHNIEMPSLQRPMQFSDIENIILQKKSSDATKT